MQGRVEGRIDAELLLLLRLGSTVGMNEGRGTAVSVSPRLSRGISSHPTGLSVIVIIGPGVYHAGPKFIALVAIVSDSELGRCYAC
jgi:hypothetical protein